MLPIIVIMLGLVSYSRLQGTENIRAIHIVSLIAIGMGIGLLLGNAGAYFRKKT